MCLAPNTLRALRSRTSTAAPLLARASSSASAAASGLSTSGSSSTPPPPPRSRKIYLLGLPLAGLACYLLPERRKPLGPQLYSEQPIGSVELMSTKRHALLTVPVAPAERAQFKEAAVSQAGAPVPENVVVVQHVMARNPTLMIERPYTPINDAEADGEMQMVVKRVRGGEVGRLIHSLQPGAPLGLRGPITTFALNPAAYDRVVMISTGTAVAPFLQLLAKAPTDANATNYTLLQAKPVSGDDWSAEYIARLEKKWGDRLTVERIEPGLVQQKDVAAAVDGAERVLVMVCLPPNIMRPLCGTLTPTLEQGPLTGLLADMGLRRHQVWKLE